MAETTANSLSGSGYRLVLTAAIISMFVVGFNTTAILTALPAIKSDLELDAQTLQWVINIYIHPKTFQFTYHINYFTVTDIRAIFFKCNAKNEGFTALYFVPIL